MEESRHHHTPVGVPSETYGYMHEMQSKLDEITQLRLRQLERMQEQQMEWQVRIRTARLKVCS